YPGVQIEGDPTRRDRIRPEIGQLLIERLIDSLQYAFVAPGNRLVWVTAEEIRRNAAGCNHCSDLTEFAIPRIFTDFDARILFECLEESLPLSFLKAAAPRRNSQGLCRLDPRCERHHYAGDRRDPNAEVPHPVHVHSSCFAV